MKLHENSVLLIREMIYDSFKDLIIQQPHTDTFKKIWQATKQKLESIEFAMVPGADDKLGIKAFKKK